MNVRANSRAGKTRPWVVFSFPINLVENEGNLLVGELAVDSGVSVGAGLNVGLVLGVEVDLDDALAVDLAAGALAGDLGGVDNVLEDGILDGGQGAGARAGGGRAGGALVGVAKNGALGDDKDMAAGELLLELADKLLVDLVERLEELVGDVKDDGLLAGTAVNLLGGGDVEVLEGALEVVGGHLKVKDLLGHLELEIIGAACALADLGCHGGGR
jgi:hypothetical protein